LKIVSVWAKMGKNKHKYFQKVAVIKMNLTKKLYHLSYYVLHIIILDAAREII